MYYFCCDERRREAVRDHPTLNGIDYLEVLDRDAPAGSPRQQTLLVHCLKPIIRNTEAGSVADLTRNNVQIEGGERITPVQVQWAFPASAVPESFITPSEQSFLATLTDANRVLVVRTDSSGDFSTYRLVLTRGRDSAPPEGFDPIVRAIEFSFKVECPSEFDCEAESICPTEPQLEPDIDYLAKDYASFRQLMLDRMAVLLPQWQERNPADLGIALVELLAYIGDRLSYQQDAIATEAYLDTALQRISVRRHARLVDYFMHDGCNARVWVQVQVNADTVLAKGNPFLTSLAGRPTRLPDTDAYRQALQQQPDVFEATHDSLLYPVHNEIHFYTWSDESCCLPKGATRATLKDGGTGARLQLRPGDVLIFIEKVSPTTGQETDADVNRRHAVRLTRVYPEPTVTRDDKGKITAIAPGELYVDPLTEQSIVDIEWHPEDALPFPLCISSRTTPEQGEVFLNVVSVALGNIVLADFGRTVEGEPLKPVPEPSLFRVPATVSAHCQQRTLEPIPPRYRPRLQEGPLTQAAAVPGASSYCLTRLPFASTASAAAAFRWQFQDVYPAITLNDGQGIWCPQRDLLGSDRFAREFVAEVDNNGQTYLRFSQNGQALSPAPGTRFTATYRVGNGTAGNVGAETIAHVVSSDSAIIRLWNPLSARGGIDPEPIETAVQSAPFAFRVQERAVTPEDYAEVAKRHPQVQRAAATFRWTGSWYTVFLTVDRFGGLPVDAAFEQEMRRHLERYRMAGYDLEIDGPRYISLELKMQVCVLPNYFRSDVKAALLEVLSDRILPDGRRGVFHPDNLTFAQPVYLSPLYAAVQAVAGVSSVNITTFQRQGQPSTVPLNTGKLILGRLEIARLENNPNFPERGVLRLQMEGGK
jgi:hypothetical protein